MYTVWHHSVAEKAVWGGNWWQIQNR